MQVFKKYKVMLFLTAVLVALAAVLSLSGEEVQDQSSAALVPFVTGYDYESKNPGLAQVYNNNGDQMVLTRILASDSSAETGNKACSKLIGSNGAPMVCKNAVESFPYLNNQGCKQFYPGAAERVSTYPGHGAHGGHYDIYCSATGTKGADGTCSQISGDTCTTCPQCAKNLDCGESLGGSSDFANGAIVRCFEDDTVIATTSGSGTGSGSGSSQQQGVVELIMTFDNSTAQDTSGKGHHGANHGATFSTSGCKYGRCANFTSSQNDYIEARNIYQIGGDATIAAWVKAGSQNIGTRIFDLHRGDGVGINVYFDAGRIVLDNGGGPSQVLFTPGTNYRDNQWHHVAATRTGSTYNLYVDGTYIGSRSGSNPTYTGYTLGRWSNGSNYLNGSLDDVYVLSMALSASQIQSLMANELTLTTSSGSTQPSGVTIKPTEAPVITETTLDDRFITEVKSGETGTEACARYNKACFDYPYMNRQACKEFYPNAASSNSSNGVNHDYFCKSGSTAEDCENPTEDTCKVCVTCQESLACEDVVETVDSAFVECVDPLEPEVIELGIPQQGMPYALGDGSGLIGYSVTASHPLNIETKIRVEVSLDGGQSFSNAIIDSVTADSGTVSLDVAQYQIGETDAVDTDEFEQVIVEFFWDSLASGVSFNDEIQFRVSIQDEGGNVAFDTTSNFTVDNTGSGEDTTPTHGSAPDGLDTDGDGIPDHLDDDIDGDGILNGEDDDVDGDGILNGEDSDVDGDGISNAIDDDIDGDGIPNGQDDDMDGDGIPNGQDPDVDGDGVPNGQDSDVDGDGIPNGQDSDVDGDGIPNGQDSDVDGDGITNGEDPDVDGDGILNGEDDDVDGDGIANTQDGDIDGDGIVNDEDSDMDGDGIENDRDQDLDQDGIPNNQDDDIDGDGILNGSDDDVDGDGVLNGEDRDVDGDGLSNGSDDDIDGDGILNGEDPDVDGDGILNGEDPDVDGDGIPNGQDSDVDGDGISNGQDSDIDGDGIANDQDLDADGDGVTNDSDEDAEGTDIPTGEGGDQVSVETEGTGFESEGAGRRGFDGTDTNCLSIIDASPIPCDDEELMQYLNELIEGNVDYADLTEDEVERAEFIKQFVTENKNGHANEVLLKIFDGVMSRAEIVELIVYLLENKGAISSADISDLVKQSYPDVDPSSPFAKAIYQATLYGIAEGYPDGTFHPDEAPNLAETARMIVQAGVLLSESLQQTLNEEASKAGDSEWYAKYLSTFLRHDIDLTRQGALWQVFPRGVDFVGYMQNLYRRSGVENPLGLTIEE